MLGATKHEKQGVKIEKRVFFEGSTALVKGQGLCYNRDYGTAADSDARRDRRVEVCSTSNNLWFAGVCDQDYAAKSGGQWITIYCPGSTCEVAIGIDTTVGSTILTCSANSVDTGRFTQPGFIGRGTALALQTNASGVLASDYAQNAALDSTGLIITHTGAFTSALVGTDTLDVYILAGEDDGTNAVTGLKTTGSRTTDNTFTIASAGSDGGTMEISYYIQNGNQRCLAYLFTGEESGLQQVYQITNGANTGLMVPGMNYIHGGFTPSADATETLADGSWIGEKVGIKLWGTLTTNDYLLTITSGVIANHAALGLQALSTAEFDAADDSLVLQWGIAEWGVVAGHGVGLA